MPNRIIKESICTSENIDNLSAEAETLFYRIMVNCDDYGRMEAGPKILRSRCYPLRIDRITDDDIKAWLIELIEANLIIHYQVDNKAYLALATWEKHQQIRAKRSKFPAPDGNISSPDNTCKQMIANDSKCPRNPIQSNPNPNPIHAEGAAADKNLSEITKIYENNIGMINPMTAEALKTLSSEYSAEWFGAAAQEACDHNARRLSYIKSILERWKVEGFKSKREFLHPIKKRPGQLPTEAELEAQARKEGLL
ncbi:MAG: DnaD domain protein [Patescibacteria group bacterium]|jgi:DnaD/phage-associated family protein